MAAYTPVDANDQITLPIKMPRQLKNAAGETLETMAFLINGAVRRTVNTNADMPADGPTRSAHARKAMAQALINLAAEGHNQIAAEEANAIREGLIAAATIPEEC
jgi:hypothetical protein